MGGSRRCRRVPVPPVSKRTYSPRRDELLQAIYVHSPQPPEDYFSNEPPIRTLEDLLHPLFERIHPHNGAFFLHTTNRRIPVTHSTVPRLISDIKERFRDYVPADLLQTLTRYSFVHTFNAYQASKSPPSCTTASAQ